MSPELTSAGETGAEKLLTPDEVARARAAERLMLRAEPGAIWARAGAAPLPLRVRIPLPSMRLDQLRSIAVGDLLTSMWPASEEVPLIAGGVTLSWCEFDVVEQHIAVRLTRLA